MCGWSEARGAKWWPLASYSTGTPPTVSDVPVGPTLWWVWQGISETIHATGENGRVLSQQERGDQWVVERPIEDARVTFGEVGLRRKVVYGSWVGREIFTVQRGLYSVELQDTPGSVTMLRRSA